MTREEIRDRIDAIERAYEFFLAFAAQGVRDDRQSPSGGQLRDSLAALAGALDGLAEGVARLARAESLGPEASWDRGLEILAEDAEAARALVEMVRGRDSVSSQMIDNLNASIHVRALLTDLFLVDELLGA